MEGDCEDDDIWPDFEKPYHVVKCPSPTFPEREFHSIVLRDCKLYKLFLAEGDCTATFQI